MLPTLSRPLLLCALVAAWLPCCGKADFIPFIHTAGEDPLEGYGVSLCADGDYDGDGFLDVAVGAWLNSRNGEEAGGIYLYSGADVPDGDADLVIPGPLAGERLGFSLAAGDLNGDGYDDLIAGAPGSSRFGAEFGCAYIFFGSGEISAMMRRILLLRGRKAESYFGDAVASGADFNGDGYHDVAVGAPKTGGLQGQVFLYFGGAEMNADPDMVCAGLKPAEAFGREVSLMGDMNGDGFADLAVGNPLKRLGPDHGPAGDGRERVGKVFLFYGASEPDTVPDVVFEGKKQISLFGWTIRGSGDLDGNGCDDLLVGAPRTMDFSGGRSARDEDEPGHVYLYFGGAEPDSLEDLTFEGESLSDGFGFSITGGDDFNRDGLPDIAIGSPASDRGGADSGAAYIFFGDADMDTVPDEVIPGSAAGDYFSYSISSYRRRAKDSPLRLLITSEHRGTGTGYEYVPIRDGQEFRRDDSLP